MTTERDRDPLERLRALQPGAGRASSTTWCWTRPGPGPVPADRRRPDISAHVRGVGRRGRPGRSPAGASPAGAPGGGAGRAGQHVGRRRRPTPWSARQPSKPQNVACFAAADLAADAGGGRRRRRRGPVAACSSVWAEGCFGPASRPPLRACVLESGVVGVFPEATGRDVCLDLGLAAASSPGRPTATPRRRPSCRRRRARRPGRRPDRFLAFRDAVAGPVRRSGLRRSGGGGGHRPGGARPGRPRRLDGHRTGRRGRGRVLRRAPVRQPQLPAREPRPWSWCPCRRPADPAGRPR